MKRVSHFINGAIYEGNSDRRGEIFNPATGQISGYVDLATREDVDRAVESAKNAFHLWRQSTLAKRTQVLFAFREILNSRKDEIVRAITSEQIGRAHV